MSAIWLDLSGKIDSLTLALLERTQVVLRGCKAPFAVIGATARDLILVHGFGCPIQRATGDVDCAVLVANWESFEEIEAAFLATGQFKKDRQPQRLYFRGNLPLDIVPFGPITGAGKTLLWPPGGDVKMNTAGLWEAYEGARAVRLRSEPPLDVPVVTLPALVGLKLIAWRDRPEERRRDALDVPYVLAHYLDAGNSESLYRDHPDLITSDFDYSLAGARLLGRDAAALFAPDTRQTLAGILDRELAQPERSLLLRHATGGTGEVDFDRTLAFLEHLRRGLGDVEGGTK